jgi:transposase
MQCCCFVKRPVLKTLSEDRGDRGVDGCILRKLEPRCLSRRRRGRDAVRIMHLIIDAGAPARAHLTAPAGPEKPTVEWPPRDRAPLQTPSLMSQPLRVFVLVKGLFLI